MALEKCPTRIVFAKPWPSFVALSLCHTFNQHSTLSLLETSDTRSPSLPVGGHLGDFILGLAPDGIPTISLFRRDPRREELEIIDLLPEKSNATGLLQAVGHQSCWCYEPHLDATGRAVPFEKREILCPFILSTAINFVKRGTTSLNSLRQFLATIRSINCEYV